MTTASQDIAFKLASAHCEVRDDKLTRRLYATDASIYQLEPQAVAFPRTPEGAALVLRAALDMGLEVTPRGGGTGLAGGAIGSGLIIDLARHNRAITDLDIEGGTVRVQPGVVLDQLNEYLKPHGLCFGPDVATSSRATLGGMIANNSSGARAPIYGTTADHLVALELALPDGSLCVAGREERGLEDYARRVGKIVLPKAEAIRERFTDERIKRWPGYGLDRYLRTGGDLTRLISGSEGTLALVTSAILKTSPLPKCKGLVMSFFTSVDEAMQASVEYLDLRPAAIEHVDRPLFDNTRGQMAFRAAREYLQLDVAPCEAFLIVEFYGDTPGEVEEKMAAAMAKPVGLRRQCTANPGQMAMVWALRKAGLSLLTGRKGPAKPIAGIEDVEVSPRDLPGFVSELEAAAKDVGLQMSFYGHAASGLVHVRPIVDLHEGDEIARFRALANFVSQLTLKYRGSLSAEHGVGIARSEFMNEHIGETLLDVMRDVKAVFDPKGLMNPGKIFPGGWFQIDTNLRWGHGYAIRPPFQPVLAFAAKDGSFVANLEQCNGCGGCRKDAPVMCPTFIATGEEAMSTRGRANTIRAALEGYFDAEAPLKSEELETVLGSCLSCKACGTECPSNVNLSLLKAEILHARHKKHGVKLYEWLIANFDLLGRMGCLAPTPANLLLSLPPVRMLMEVVTRVSAKRPLPKYAMQRFDRWFEMHKTPTLAKRGKVILWDDCSTRYHEPEIGRAAVRVLEAAGYQVELLGGHACCGRPAFSVGMLDIARNSGRVNLALLARKGGDAPIIFLEPSCFSMFREDYIELKLDGAEQVSKRAVLFEHFMADLLEREPDALDFAPWTGGPVAIHAHCHAKAMTPVQAMPALARRLPGAQVTLLDSACCGMAGSFGMMRDKYELSLEVARPLIEMVNRLPQDVRLVASGTSCRQQITHLSRVKPLHAAELLAEGLSLLSPPGETPRLGA